MHCGTLLECVSPVYIQSSRAVFPIDGFQESSQGFLTNLFQGCLICRR